MSFEFDHTVAIKNHVSDGSVALHDFGGNELTQISINQAGAFASIYMTGEELFGHTQQCMDRLDQLQPRRPRPSMPIDPAETLADAMRIAVATVELHTGNGAQEQPAGWPRTPNGDIDYEQVAKMCRAALAAYEASK